MWINRAVKWLLPSEEHFFDRLERGAGLAERSAPCSPNAARQSTMTARRWSGGCARSSTRPTTSSPTCTMP